jgi:PKHD-type hydroxylase
MRGEWCYFKKHFTPEECNLILEMGLKLPAEDAKLGVDGAYSDDQWRKSKIRFIKKQNIQFEWLFDRMWKMAIQANDDWFDFHLSKIEYMQLAEYDSAYQGEYKKHHDVFWMNNDPKYHRKVSAVVQLTDPSTYEGGNFEVLLADSTKCGRTPYTRYSNLYSLVPRPPGHSSYIWCEVQSSVLV